MQGHLIVTTLAFTNFYVSQGISSSVRINSIILMIVYLSLFLSYLDLPRREELHWEGSSQ